MRYVGCVGAGMLGSLLGFGLAWAAAPAAPTQPEPPKIRPLRDVTFESSEARVARGKYLAEGVLQCFVCHSDRDWGAPGAPPKAGMKGAGQVMRDEPGKRVVAPNITPDRETGAGDWTDDMFARAIREGVGHDDRLLHQQMWSESFRRSRKRTSSRWSSTCARCRPSGMNCRRPIWTTNTGPRRWRA